MDGDVLRPTKASSCPKRAPGRPRDPETERQILLAAGQLILSGVSIGSLSIQEIATQAKVGKPTIYRRWRNKECLLSQLFSTLREPMPQFYGSDLREDLMFIVADLHRWATEDGSIGFMPHVLAEARRYPELVESYYNAVIRPRIALLRATLARWAEAEQLRPDVDHELIIDILLGLALAKWLRQQQCDAPRSKPFCPNSMVKIFLEGAGHYRICRRPGGGMAN